MDLRLAECIDELKERFPINKDTIITPAYQDKGKYVLTYQNGELEKIYDTRHFKYIGYDSELSGVDGIPSFIENLKGNKLHPEEGTVELHGVVVERALSRHRGDFILTYASKPNDEKFKSSSALTKLFYIKAISTLLLDNYLVKTYPIPFTILKKKEKSIHEFVNHFRSHEYPVRGFFLINGSGEYGGEGDIEYFPYPFNNHITTIDSIYKYYREKGVYS